MCVLTRSYKTHTLRCHCLFINVFHTETFKEQTSYCILIIWNNTIWHLTKVRTFWWKSRHCANERNKKHVWPAGEQNQFGLELHKLRINRHLRQSNGHVKNQIPNLEFPVVQGVPPQDNFMSNCKDNFDDNISDNYRENFVGNFSDIFL